MLLPMTNGPDLWERVYNEFEPETPAKTPEQRAEREYSPVPDIVRSLARPFGAKKFLITGSVGAGKTTELHRIAEEQVEHQIVVLFDVYAHFEQTVKDAHAINNLESWELLFLVGLAVYGAAAEEFDHKWDRKVTKALEDAIKALQDPKNKVEIDVGKLASSVLVLVGGASGALLGGPALGAGAGALVSKLMESETAGAVGTAALKAVNSVATAVRWNLPIGRQSREPRSDQDGQVVAMLNAVNLIIGEVQKNYRQVLVLLDGLDRITDRDNIEALFVRSSLLADLVCPMVAIAPISVRRGHMDTVRGFEAKDLVNVPVVARHKPNYPNLGEGVSFFHELMALRMKKLGLTDMRLFTTEQINRMAWCSGGRARDFVKLVRGVAERAWDEKLDRVTGAIVEASVDEARRKKESGLNSEEIALLEQVLRDERRALPGKPEAISLLDKQRLVPYPNESTWYFPHPLLTLNLVKPS